MEMEKAALQKARSFDALPREEKESLWAAVKQAEKKNVTADKLANAESQPMNAKNFRMSTSNRR
jgi:hypothetical protein